MPKVFRLLAALLPIFVMGTSIHAQETNATSDAGWPVEERCLGAPTKPPQAWSYDGTILMTGYAGIHGVNAQWDTPRVLAQLSDKDVWGGAVSPDGKWYAVPHGEVFRTQSNNVITDITQIYVYSLLGDNEKIVIDWPLTESYQMTHAQIYWRGNNDFIFPNDVDTSLVNLFSKKKDDWPEPGFIYDAYEQYRSKFAPDWSRAIYTQEDDETGYRVRMLYVLPSNHRLATLSIEPPISWMPSSSEFIATFIDREDTIPSSQLVLFDREGNLLEKIADSQLNKQFGISTQGWSNDNRYFAFITFDYSIYGNYSRDNRLYIADMEERVVIDTCRAIGEGLAWSPTGDQLTFLEVGEGLKRILLLDMQSYDIYGVANHIVGYDYRIYQGNDSASDRIMGWRTD